MLPDRASKWASLPATTPRIVTPAAVRELAQRGWGLQTTEASYVLLRPNQDAMLDKRDPWQ